MFSFLARIRVPHIFTLLAGIVALSALLTWFVPSGRYEREEKTIGTLTRTLVKPGTYETVPKHYSIRAATIGESVDGKATPVGLVGIFKAIPRGLEASADIVFFIFIVGGVFGILQKTGLLTAAIHKLIDALGHSAVVLTAVVMVAVGIGGSTLGMGEEFIPLVPVFLLISKRLGYDRIYGLALLVLGSEIGFAAATTNPFTVAIAQGIAEVKIGSGMGFRIVFFIVCMVITVAYVLRYGARLRRDPSKSIMADDPFDIDEAEHEHVAFGRRHFAAMLACIAVFVGILVGAQQLGWWLSEMAGGFLAMGLIAAWILGLTAEEATHAFIDGMRDMVVAAMVVGFARGILVVMEDGLILDTFIAHAASVLQTWPSWLSVQGMLLFQTTLNFFVPSGSGQAAVTMPLMAPLADVLGISRQTAVFAYQCGDGFSNIIIPTSGILMAMLALAKIPYERWLRFVLPLFMMLLGVSALFLGAAVVLGLE